MSAALEVHREETVLSKNASNDDDCKIENVTHDCQNREEVDSEFTEPEVLDCLSDTESDTHCHTDNDVCDTCTILHNESSGLEDLTTLRKRHPRRKSKTSCEELTDSQKDKIALIEEALSFQTIDLERLRELAIGDHGFVTDELRRKAWPHLMQIDKLDSLQNESKDVIHSYKDYNQVVLDVNRTLKRFPPGIEEHRRMVLMEQLTDLIIQILCNHPHLHYYQGFHDVAITFLLVMGENAGCLMVERLSLTHLHEFMRPTMERTTYYLTYLFPILRKANPHLHDFIVKSEVGTVFCLPWLITWFAHTLADYRDVVRLYDFLLASPYLMPMYVAAVIVLYREHDIMAEECDMAVQHYILSKVPETLPFEDLLKQATELYAENPPETLQEEVEAILCKRKEKEAEEKQQADERRRKYLRAVGNKTMKRGALSAVCAGLTYSLGLPSRNSRVVGVVAVAVTATLVTSLYGYYSKSSYLAGFVPWGWWG